MTKRLPTQINVTKGTTYEIADVVHDMLHDGVIEPDVEPTREQVLSYIDDLINEDFNGSYGALITDENGKEIPEWQQLISEQ